MQSMRLPAYISDQKGVTLANTSFFVPSYTIPDKRTNFCKAEKTCKGNGNGIYVV
jgi:hypothetical protein